MGSRWAKHRPGNAHDPPFVGSSDAGRVSSGLIPPYLCSGSGGEITEKKKKCVSPLREWILPPLRKNHKSPAFSFTPPTFLHLSLFHNLILFFPSFLISSSSSCLVIPAQCKFPLFGRSSIHSLWPLSTGTPRCPPGHTGTNSMRFLSTMPTWTSRRDCGWPGMRGCRTMS